MSEPKVRESTLSFNFNEQMYESAGELPTMYRALNLAPRTGHPYWIYEAIQRQPELVRESIETIPEAAEKIAKAFMDGGKKRILLSGIGASYHLAACAAHVLWSVAGIPCEFVESSEGLLSDIPWDYPNLMFFGLSASGNSKETVEHALLAKQNGAFVVSMTNLDHTRLTAAADISYVAPGGYGLVWDLTTRLAPFAYLASELALRLGKHKEDILALRAALTQIPYQMTSTLKAIDGVCRRVGVSLQSRRSVVIPASGNLLPVAWEMALRFEEMAHYPAKGRPVVDFLHGGVGYVAENIATVVMAAPGKTYSYSQRLAQVTQTLKTPCIAVVSEEDEQIAPLGDEVIRIPETHPALRPLLYLLPAQLIPYYTEVARPGGNPDAQQTDQPKYARAFDVAYPPKSH